MYYRYTFLYVSQLSQHCCVFVAFHAVDLNVYFWTVSQASGFGMQESNKTSAL